MNLVVGSFREDTVELYWILMVGSYERNLVLGIGSVREHTVKLCWIDGKYTILEFIVACFLVNSAFLMELSNLLFLDVLNLM